MEKVYANWQLPVYEVIGPVVRVHWNYEQITQEDIDDESYEYWVADEVVFPLDVDRETFISIITEAGGPAEDLANGWFSVT